MYLTDEESYIIGKVLDQVITKENDIGNLITKSKQDSIFWTLVGTLRWGGIEDVKQVGEKYTPQVKRADSRGYV